MLYKDLSLQLIGSAITVYHTLGPGLAEKIYQEALAIVCFAAKNTDYSLRWLGFFHSSK